jgi:hypothetical protein
MNNKTFWIGLVVIFVLMQAIGFAVHEVWLEGTYEGLADVASVVIAGAVFAAIYKPSPA